MKIITQHNYNGFLTSRKDVNFKNKNYNKLTNGLKIDSVSRAEAGTYECTATNEFDSIKSKAAYLRIKKVTNVRIPVSPVPLRTTTAAGRLVYSYTSQVILFSRFFSKKNFFILER